MARFLRSLFILVGIAAVAESVYTPGFQLFASLAGGGIIGANIRPLIKGE